MDELFSISNGNISAVISSLGAELRSLVKGNEEYMWERNPEFWKGCAPIVFPVCGTYRDDKYEIDGKTFEMAKHGFIRFREFSVENKNDDSLVLYYKSSKEDLKFVPSPFIFRVKFELKFNSIAITYIVENIGDCRFPYAIGAHEGYEIYGDLSDYSIKFEKTEDLKSQKNQGKLCEYDTIDFGKTDVLRLSNELFTVDALAFKDIKSRSVKLIDKKGEARLTVKFEDFSNLLLWTKPNAKYICIEPWLKVPDFNDTPYDVEKKQGVVILNPNEKKEHKHEIIL